MNYLEYAQENMSILSSLFCFLIIVKICSTGQQTGDLGKY